MKERITASELQILAAIRNELRLLAEEPDCHRCRQQLSGMATALRSILRAHDNPTVKPIIKMKSGLQIEWPDSYHEQKEALK